MKESTRGPKERSEHLRVTTTKREAGNKKKKPLMLEITIPIIEVVFGRPGITFYPPSVIAAFTASEIWKLVVVNAAGCHQLPQPPETGSGHSKNK